MKVTYDGTESGVEVMLGDVVTRHWAGCGVLEGEITSVTPSAYYTVHAAFEGGMKTILSPDGRGLVFVRRQQNTVVSELAPPATDVAA